MLTVIPIWLSDWLKKFLPHFYPIRSKTRSDGDSLAHFFDFFPLFAWALSFDWFIDGFDFGFRVLNCNSLFLVQKVTAVLPECSVIV